MSFFSEDEIGMKIRDGFKKGINSIKNYMDDNDVFYSENRIECEYCKTTYNAKKEDRCPSCGAVNREKRDQNNG